MGNAEATPRPWHVEECEQCPERGRIYIHAKGWLDPNELIAESVKTDRDVDCGGVADAEANAELIVRAVNAHDALVAALAACITELSYSDSWQHRHGAEIAQARAALLLAKRGAPASSNDEAA